MSTYERCDDEVRQVLALALKHHPDLVEAGVTFDLLFAHASVNADGVSTGVALNHHGYRACAVVKVNNLRRRAAGGADAEIVIDGDRWPDWSQARRVALLDHELSHLEPIVEGTSREGRTLYRCDDLDRPKLRTLVHDWQTGGFAAVVERHGGEAVEASAIQVLMDHRGQLFWPLLSPPEAATAAPQGGAKVSRVARHLVDGLRTDPALRRAAAGMVPEDGSVTFSATGPDGKPLAPSVTLTRRGGQVAHA